MKTKAFKHGQLIGQDQKNFIETYYRVEENDKVFQFFKKSSLTMYLWIFYIFSFCTLSFHYNKFNILNIIIFCSGIVGFQIVFIFSNMAAHSLFFEYENHVPGNSRMPNSVIYYYAFYHYYYDVVNNWAPFLSFHNFDVAINIVVAH